KSGKRWNFISGMGMLIGIFAALIQPMGDVDNNYMWIAGSMVIGAVIGYPLAVKVKMTAMPQLVALFNGLGGASATTIGIVEVVKVTSVTPAGSGIVSILSLIIRTIIFTGCVRASD